jgi:hypothetical protein
VQFGYLGNSECRNTLHHIENEGCFYYHPNSDQNYYALMDRHIMKLTAGAGV